MKKHLSKRRVIVSAIVVVALAIAGGVAFAYFSASGAGTGTAQSANPSSTITLNATFTDGIYPGGNKSVSFTADNGNPDTSSFVGTIQFGSVTSSNGACQTLLNAHADQFSMVAVTEDTRIAAGASGAALPNAGSLVWTDTDYAQDACKNVPLTLHVTS
jgi:hypothetical protein